EELLKGFSECDCQCGGARGRAGEQRYEILRAAQQLEASSSRRSRLEPQDALHFPGDVLDVLSQSQLGFRHLARLESEHLLNVAPHKLGQLRRQRHLALRHRVRFSTRTAPARRLAPRSVPLVSTSRALLLACHLRANITARALTGRPTA